jgi:hypothetical protein
MLCELSGGEPNAGRRTGSPVMVDGGPGTGQSKETAEISVESLDAMRSRLGQSHGTIT